jgi:sugar lactone lactonase YvrE
VPTSIAVGPDGAYYVGQLTGAPFRDGAASVYRLLPGEAPQVFLTGFKAIIDLAFDEAGNLYVLQHATGPTMLTGPGMLIRVAPDGTRTAVLTGLDRPTSVAVGPDDALYVTNHGLSAGSGEVLRVEP